MRPISVTARRVLRNIRDGKPHEEGLTKYQIPHLDTLLDALVERRLINGSIQITRAGREHLRKYEN